MGSASGTRGRSVALSAALCLACACASERTADLPPVAAGPSPAARGIPVLGVAATPLGDGSRAAELAALLGGGGLRGARVRCEDAVWSAMQPDPAGPIDFSRLDAFVRAYQSQGMSELLVCLDTGSRRAPRRGALSARGAVTSAHELAHFETWAAAVVERYDADGVDDMPGLALPVRLYEVGIEFAGRHGVSIDAYLRLLERVYRAAHAADPQVVVAHAALLLAASPESAAPARLGLLSEADRARLLEHAQHYDAINLQAVADAGSLDAALAGLRAELLRLGIRKPVILSHLAPSPLIGWGRATSCEQSARDLGLVVPPAREGDRCALAAHFRRLLAKDAGALAWSWRFAAAELVRKSVVAASHGVVAVFAGPTEDTPWWRDPALEAAAGVTAWSGLVDARTRSRRPAHGALEQLARVFEGGDAVERVDMGDPDVRLYAVTGPRGPVWVGWYEGRALALPGTTSTGLEIEFEVGEAGLWLTPMATLGRPESRPARLDERRRARILLGQEPIYMRPTSRREVAGPRSRKGART